jgi:hypothetical protein
MQRGDALIRILHRVDPDALDDKAWAQRLTEAHYFFQTLGNAIMGDANKSQS